MTTLTMCVHMWTVGVEMHQGFTPLFSGIVNSSVWSSTKDVKVLWVTMLALKDKNGFVRAVPSALARVSGLTPEEAKAALDVLESPDPESSCKEHEGRRIQKVDGGWYILSHARYQKLMSDTFTRSRKTVWERVKRENMRQEARREEKLDAVNAMKRPKHWSAANKVVKAEGDGEPKEGSNVVDQSV